MKTGPAFPILKTSAKSVQTTAEVCADYSWSLQKVLRTYEFIYDVLTEISTRTYWSVYVYLLQRVRCTHFGKCAHLQKPVSELSKQLIGKGDR